jgi:hypothetical protein
MRAVFRGVSAEQTFFGRQRGVVLGIAHRYIESEDLLVTVWHGPVTWEEWEALARRQVGEPASSAGRRRLTDARGADTSALTPDHAEAISAIYAATGAELSGTQLAIVADDMSALAENVRDSLAALHITALIFNRLEVACAWFDADVDITSDVISELRAELDTHILRLV